MESNSLSRRQIIGSAIIGAAAVGGSSLPAEAMVSKPLDQHTAADSAIFARYVAFLAHEHAQALYALHRASGIISENQINGPLHRFMPMYHMPSDREVLALMGGSNTPEHRAIPVLNAVGLGHVLESI